MIVAQPAGHLQPRVDELVVHAQERADVDEIRVSRRARGQVAEHRVSSGAVNPPRRGELLAIVDTLHSRHGAQAGRGKPPCLEDRIDAAIGRVALHIKEIARDLHAVPREDPSLEIGALQREIEGLRSRARRRRG